MRDFEKKSENNQRKVLISWSDIFSIFGIKHDFIESNYYHIINLMMG